VYTSCRATAGSTHTTAFITKSSTGCCQYLDNQPFIRCDFLSDIEKWGDREPIGLQSSPGNFNEHGT
jgi:hypothetical protein